MSSEPTAADIAALSRIAVVAPGEIFGGAERQIITLLRALSSRGLTSRLLTFHDRDLAREARAAGIETTILGSRGLLDVKSLKLLKGSLRSFQPQVLHVHGYRASVYSALAVRRGSIAVVKTEHGGVEAGGPLMRDRLRPLIYRRLEIWASRWLRVHVVFVTGELQSRCLGEFPGLENTVIYNGIETLQKPATAKPPEYGDKNVNIAIVGRLEPVKGIEYALRAMTLPAMPPSVKLHVIGSGPLQFELECLTGSLGIRERVHFAGFRRNVYDYIAHADALLMPSLHEGLPYTILEAMVLGTPVLTSRVGGLAEILTEERTALQFEPASEDAIAETVARLASNRSLRDSLASAARAEAIARFSSDAMTDHYLGLYESLVSRS